MTGVRSLRIGTQRRVTVATAGHALVDAPAAETARLERRDHVAVERAISPPRPARSSARHPGDRRPRLDRAEGVDHGRTLSRAVPEVIADVATTSPTPIRAAAHRAVRHRRARRVPSAPIRTSKRPERRGTTRSGRTAAVPRSRHSLLAVGGDRIDDRAQAAMGLSATALRRRRRAGRGQRNGCFADAAGTWGYRIRGAVAAPRARLRPAAGQSRW